MSSPFTSAGARGGDTPGSTPTPIADKVAHVRGGEQSRRHTCHWPGCDTEVRPAMWGCKSHWMRLPRRLRNRIWETYEIGQEISMTPSDEYLEVAREVQEWIEVNT